jgi:hypothetical protein
MIDEGVGASASGDPKSRSGRSRTAEPERREFWDSFGAPAAEERGGGQASAIGTAAVRKKNEGTMGGKGKDEGWEEW